MVKTRKLGIIYSYNENWIGGTYYIHNLLKAIQLLPVHKQPNIVAITDSEEEFKKLQLATGYTKLTAYITTKVEYYNFFQKVINKIWWTFFRKLFFENRNNVADTVFPIMSFRDIVWGRKPIFWIPDFQEKQLPHFFQQEDIEKRRLWQEKVSKLKHVMVLSSNDAFNAYKQYYPTAKTINKVVRFAVFNDVSNLLPLEKLKLKVEIPKNYFISPNQFWAHKNHIVILKAISFLKENNITINVVFTGKESDYRNPTYFTTLTDFVKNNQLEKQVFFLGFIDRSDQLSLIKESVAVIQPSKCEGWSTVVEDAKSLSKMVIASELDVHKEQLGSYGKYFQEADYQQLAFLLKQVYFDNEISQIDYQYHLQQEQFAKEFLNTLLF